MIIQADILKWAETYQGPKFHAMLSDPPYHLTEITKRFGKPGSAPAQFGTDGAYQRAGRGFMGKDWDGGDIAFRPETWAAMAEHLYPGAWGMAFAGSRGWHRMACAIEDAGLIMQPTIFGWAYGSGFPKATRIDTQLDARAFRAWLKLHPLDDARLKALRKAEREQRKARNRTACAELKAAIKELTTDLRIRAGLMPIVVGQKKHQPKFAAAELGYREKDNGYNSKERLTFDLTHPALEEAERWLGHRYGGQAMKPAIEPIIVFQKPYDGSPLTNITTTGAGALWIDGGRIGDSKDVPASPRRDQDKYFSGLAAPAGDTEGWNPNTGRWPANFILSHSPSCNGTCAPGCPVARLGAQSGESSGNERHNDRHYEPKNPEEWRMASHEGARRTIEGTGTAARFFYQADYMYERLELADAIAYVAKASRAEREAGLDPRYTAIMRLLDDSDDDEVFDETTVDDGRAVPIDNPYQRGETARRNTHPTIKPISLTRYLATLLLPPAQYGPRRLLIPFSGAGSEIIGADLAGWEDVTGVELEADHVAIANARRAYWQQRRWEFGDPARKLSMKAAPKAPRGQMDMFVESEAA